MSIVRIHVAAAILVLSATLGAEAQNQPIQGPVDAACRDEARDKVFSAPNPKGLSPFDLGAEIYHACMRRMGAKTGLPPRR